MATRFGPDNLLEIFDSAGNKATVALQNGQVVVSTPAGAAFLALNGGFGDEQQLLARSQSAFGTSSFAAVFDELDGPLASNWQVLGAWTAQGAKGPGVFGVASAADAIIIRQSLAFVAAPNVTPWHIAGRQMVVAAMAAADIKGFQLVAVGGNPDTDSVMVGQRQAISTTKLCFALIKGGVVTTALSTVSIDTNWHKCELWFNGTNVFGSIDNEAPVLVGTAANCPTVALQERHGCDQGAGAAVDQFYDWVYAAAARTTS